MSNSDQLVSGSLDCKIKIWSLNKGVCLQTLKGHTKWVANLACDASELIISGSGDFSIKMWDWKKGVCLKTLYESISIVEFLYFCEIKQELMVAWRDGTLKKWNCFSTLNWNFSKNLKCKDALKENLEYLNYKLISIN